MTIPMRFYHNYTTTSQIANKASTLYSCSFIPTKMGDCYHSLSKSISSSSKWTPHIMVKSTHFMEDSDGIITPNYSGIVELVDICRFLINRIAFWLHHTKHRHYSILLLLSYSLKGLMGLMTRTRWLNMLNSVLEMGIHSSLSVHPNACKFYYVVHFVCTLCDCILCLHFVLTTSLFY